MGAGAGRVRATHQRAGVMTDRMDGIDWDDALANAPYIEAAESYPDAWAAKAAAFRERARGDLDIAYGAADRERLDLFRPETTPKGLVVFVHGGYWLRFDKSYWSYLAQGPIAKGWAVALPSYTLAPAVRLPRITEQIAGAIECAAGRVAGPIILTGHSAGGHLVTRMLCPDVVLSARQRIAHVLSISGLHDLRPLLAARMNEELQLSEKTALAESPALHHPAPDTPVTIWVGGHERPEFLRQSALLREAWGGLGCDARLVVDGTRHHFDVISGLEHPESLLTRTLLNPKHREAANAEA